MQVAVQTLRSSHSGIGLLQKKQRTWRRWPLLRCSIAATLALVLAFASLGILLKKRAAAHEDEMALLREMPETGLNPCME